ncbi:MAG: hypothetical protein Q8K93_00445 [Reyranella sp.]|uniref:hypothetical protein n=1 Tax=Reyranella sp. TaxID=1929291 RepID=UPI002731B05C|nr:hypothetical protein [Reyranella sp.]MDP1960645.1 hypothetical protein [Reyranella sp.]MDP2376911.1 hypothetical protein [Reyranella sp.]
MHKPLDLALPEDWKQRTRVFVTRRTPFQAMTPMVPKEAYDAERNGRDRAGAAWASASAMWKFTLRH